MKFRVKTLTAKHSALGKTTTRWETLSGALAKYIFPYGITHLIKSNLISLAISVNTNFEAQFLRRRTEGRSGIERWLIEYKYLMKREPMQILSQWEDLIRANYHHFFKTHFPADKVLFQIAINQSDDSMITKGAEKFFSDGKCTWSWLRQLNRPKNWTQNPLVATLKGDGFRGLCTSESLVVSWTLAEIQIWDIQTQLATTIKSGHQISGVLVDDNLIFYWSNTLLTIWEKTNKTEIKFENIISVSTLKSHIALLSNNSLFLITNSGSIVSRIDENAYSMTTEDSKIFCLCKDQIRVYHVNIFESSECAIFRPSLLMVSALKIIGIIRGKFIKLIPDGSQLHVFEKTLNGIVKKSFCVEKPGDLSSFDDNSYGTHINSFYGFSISREKSATNFCGKLTQKVKIRVSSSSSLSFDMELDLLMEFEGKIHIGASNPKLVALVCLLYGIEDEFGYSRIVNHFKQHSFDDVFKEIVSIHEFFDDKDFDEDFDDAEIETLDDAIIKSWLELNQDNPQIFTDQFNSEEIEKRTWMCLPKWPVPIEEEGGLRDFESKIEFKIQFDSILQKLKRTFTFTSRKTLEFDCNDARIWGNFLIINNCNNCVAINLLTEDEFEIDDRTVGIFQSEKIIYWTDECLYFGLNSNFSHPSNTIQVKEVTIEGEIFTASICHEFIFLFKNISEGKEEFERFSKCKEIGDEKVLYLTNQRHTKRKYVMRLCSGVSEAIQDIDGDASFVYNKFSTIFHTKKEVFKIKNDTSAKIFSVSSDAHTIAGVYPTSEAIFILTNNLIIALKDRHWKVIWNKNIYDQNKSKIKLNEMGYRVAVRAPELSGAGIFPATTENRQPSKSRKKFTLLHDEPSSIRISPKPQEQIFMSTSSEHSVFWCSNRSEVFLLKHNTMTTEMVHEHTADVIGSYANLNGILSCSKNELKILRKGYLFEIKCNISGFFLWESTVLLWHENKLTIIDENFNKEDFFHSGTIESVHSSINPVVKTSIGYFSIDGKKRISDLKNEPFVDCKDYFLHHALDSDLESHDNKSAMFGNRIPRFYRIVEPTKTNA